MATTEAVLATISTCSWDYAGLAHAAHAAGSPAKLINEVSKTAAAAGQAAGIAKGAAAAGPAGFAMGAFAVLAFGRVYLRYTRRIAELEAAKARAMASIAAAEVCNNGCEEEA